MESEPQDGRFRDMVGPIRWLALELLRLVAWLDQSAGRLLDNLRRSPAWSIVILFGTTAIGLTLLLFISMSESSTTTADAQSVIDPVRHLKRSRLQWWQQDRWRIAHAFVRHQPRTGYRNIAIDSRLTVADSTELRPGSSESVRARSGVLRNAKDVDVRLELSRPKRAQQAERLVTESAIQLATFPEEIPARRTHYRDSRLLVQASWEFTSDCGQESVFPVRERNPAPVRHYEPVRRVPPPEVEPPRTEPLKTKPAEPIAERPKVQPLPEPELELFEVNEPPPKGEPLLSLETQSWREFVPYRPFPEGAHIVEQSERSQFPRELLEQRSLARSSEWLPYDAKRNGRRTAPLGYAGIGNYDPEQESILTLDTFDSNLPSATEIHLQIELNVTDSATGDAYRDSIFIVRNLGPSPLPLVEAVDFVTPSSSVVAAEPPAEVGLTYDPDSGTSEEFLHRKRLDLRSGSQQEFDLTWIPEPGRTSGHRVQVTASALVSTVTEVVIAEQKIAQPMPSIAPELPVEIEPQEHPALVCDIEYPETAVVGEELQCKLAVRNTGDTDLHNVQVRIELPQELTHRDGAEFVFVAGSLAPGGRHQTVVKLQAKRLGKAVNRLHVTADERVQASGEVTILIEAHARVVPVKTPDAEPAKPNAVSLPGISSPPEVKPAPASNPPETSLRSSNSPRQAPCVCREPVALWVPVYQ